MEGMHRWLLVMLLFSGCAFSISGPEPDRPRHKMPRCDTGKGLVALDGAMAAIAGVAAVSVASEEPALALLPLALGSIYVGGAVRGNNNANKCRAAMGEYESYIAARETLASSPPSYVNAPIAPPGAEPVASHVDMQQPLAPPAMQAPPPAPVPPPSTAPIAAPPPARPAAKPAGKPAPAPRLVSAEQWGEFWREVE
jgi:hypothetical protein